MYRETTTESHSARLPTPSDGTPVGDGAAGSFDTHAHPASFSADGQWTLPAQQEPGGDDSTQLLSVGEPLSALDGLEVTNTSWLSEDNTLPGEADSWRPDILGEDSFWSSLPIFSHMPSEQGHLTLESSTGGNIVSTATLSNGGVEIPIPDPSADSGSLLRAHSDGNSWQKLPSRNHFAFADSQSSPNSVLSLTEIPSSEISLLRHFVDFAVPPILIGVEPRWTSARHALFKIAKSSLVVRHAICSFSALSLADEDNLGRARTTSQTSAYFYDLASTELHNEIDGLAGEGNDARRHENILASIFFLSYVELMMSSAPKHTLELLGRAYAISRETQPSKSLLGNQLRIWLKLLDARVVSAGGEGIHLVNNPELRDLESPSDQQRSSTRSVTFAEAPTSTEVPPVDAEETLFNCINHSAYNFYVEVLDFAGRIAQLDRWHRSRGSVADELEVMQAAQEILNDLDSLWNRRPAILDLASGQHNQLIRHLSNRLAKNVLMNLRTYVANFYACLIHVQRALFPHLPTTPQTTEAIERIVELVRLCDHDQVKPSVSMLWPLMMAGCEVSDVDTRIWLTKTVEAMNRGLGNTARTAKLIREICRRQEGGHRADARTVMQEIFGTIFAII